MKVQEITDEDLAIDWTLTEVAARFILKNTRGQEPTLRFAMQLCTLRITGKFIDAYNELSLKVVNYLALQLELEPMLFLSDPIHQETELKYREVIGTFLGYRPFTEETQSMLENWSVKILRSDFIAQKELTKKAKAYLKSQRIVLPAPSRLGRFIAAAIKKSRETIYRQITDRLSEKQKVSLDMLIEKSGRGRTLSEYKIPPPEPSATIMKTFIARYQYLSELHLDAINLEGVEPEIVENFSKLSNCYSIRELREISPDSKRHALLACFIYEASKKLLDDIINMNHNLLGKVMRESKNTYDKELKHLRKKAKEGLETTVSFVDRLFAYTDPEHTSLQTAFEDAGKKNIKSALEKTKEVTIYEKEGLGNILNAKYTNLRKYTPSLFELDFEAATGSEALLEAINVARKLNRGELQEIPADAPVCFVLPAWAPIIVNNEGTLNRRSWEMSLYFAMKKGLDSSDLFLINSESHRNFWETIYAKNDWNTAAPKAYIDLKLSKEFDDMLATLTSEYETHAAMANRNLTKDSFAYISHEDELKIRRDDALEIPESTDKLRSIIQSKLPTIRIEKLLSEVDQLTHFSKDFVPFDGYVPKKEYSIHALYAALIAHGTNIGLYNMANSTEGMSTHDIADVSRWRIRKSCLEKSNSTMINKHMTYPITQVYGDGSGSASDGQRFGIEKSSNLAALYPRYYGYYDRVISIYTHMSNQFSVFSTQVISCAAREAAYVLTGLLSNSSKLNPTFHSTDTGGYTNQVFALCYLLGFSFQPRLKDLKHKQLFKLDKSKHYGQIETLFKGNINIELIMEQWDNIVRLLASLKNNIHPAHLIIQRLASRASFDKLSKAVLELGKLVTTIYIMRYISDPEIRRVVQSRLCRCESRHNLAQHAFFFNQGRFKTSDYEQIMNKASCLSFLSNAILLWNTHHIQHITDHFKRSGIQYDDEDLARISPLLFKHIIMHGTYNFNEVYTHG